VCRSAGFAGALVGCAHWAGTWCGARRIGARFLGGRVVARCGEVLELIADEHGWQVVAKEVMGDHVQLFVQVGLTEALVRVVWAFKGCTAQLVRSEFAYLRRFAKVLWSPSCFAASARMSKSRWCTARSSIGGMR
jgi:REP-associated tyrosine transposase